MTPSFLTATPQIVQSGRPSLLSQLTVATPAPSLLSVKTGQTAKLGLKAGGEHAAVCV